MHRARAVLVGLWVVQQILRQLWLLGSPNGNLLRFGSEYGNIAESLVLQGSFADAMGPSTGPSAWMPPALCWLYAAVFSMFGVKSIDSALVLLTLKSLLTGVCLWHFLAMVQSRWGGRGVVGGVVLSLLWSECDAHRFYAELDDIWWINGLALGVLRQVLGQGSPGVGMLLALLVPLSSPSLTLAWALVVVARRTPRWPLILGLMACSCLLWGARNQLALGRFYPVKSNLWFDFVEANLWDDDGLLTHSFFRLYHPINGNTLQQQYRQLGEVAFVEAARQLARQIPPRQWARRCLRRLANCTLRTQIDWDLFPALQVPSEDLPRLVESRWLLVHAGKPFWLFCLRSPERFQAAMAELRLGQPEQVLHSRMAACAELQRRHRQPGLWWSQWHFSLLPGLALLVLLVRRQEGAVIALYLLFLLPYVLVQHYARYQVSLVWVQHYLVLAGLLNGRRHQHG